MSKRLEEIENSYKEWGSMIRGNDVKYLIARVKRLTEALELIDHCGKCEACQKTARKALEELP